MEGSVGSPSPCSCWRQMRPCPPLAEAHSWPDEMGESAVASHHPGSRTASSHMSFAPPWLPVLPPGPQKNHPAHALSYWSPVETHLHTMAATAADTDPPPGAAVRAPTLLTNCCMERDTKRLSSCGFTMYLHRFEHCSGQTWCKQIICLRTLWRIPDFSHAAVNQPGEGASFCGETHSMILSWRLNGPRESRPSLLITCTWMKVTPPSFSTLVKKKEMGGKSTMNEFQPAGSCALLPRWRVRPCECRSQQSPEELSEGSDLLSESQPPAVLGPEQILSSQFPFKWLRGQFLVHF